MLDYSAYEEFERYSDCDVSKLMTINRDGEIRELMSFIGKKYDTDKIRPNLVFDDMALALIEVCKLGTYGAVKYGDRNWLDVEDGFERYTNAMYRHMLDQDEDESGCSKEAHVAWNALARLELKLREELCGS